ncbi:hypothetical protein ACFX11_028343 [Malus domestica]
MRNHQHNPNFPISNATRIFTVAWVKNSSTIVTTASTIVTIASTIKTTRLSTVFFFRTAPGSSRRKMMKTETATVTLMSVSTMSIGFAAGCVMVSRMAERETSTVDSIEAYCCALRWSSELPWSFFFFFSVSLERILKPARMEAARDFAES